MAHSDVNRVPSQSLLSLPHRCECLALGCFWQGAQVSGAGGGWVGEWVGVWVGSLLVLKASKDGPANLSSSIWPRCDSAPCLCVHSQMSASVEPTSRKVWDVSGQVFKRQRGPKWSGREREGLNCF